MKKILALIALVALAACGGSYDYYKGGVRYVQDGANCIYSSDEVAHKYSADVNSADIGKKIVYRNTKCADLYARDMAGQEPRAERRVLTPAAVTEDVFVEPVAEPHPIVVKSAPVVKKSCGCNKCGKKKTTTKQYVVVGM